MPPPHGRQEKVIPTLKPSVSNLAGGCTYFKPLWVKRWAIQVALAGMIFGVVLAGGCGKKQKEKFEQEQHNTVTLHLLSDPDMLNPTNYQGADAGYILDLIFQSLLSIDHKSLELVPVVATSRPRIEIIHDTLIYIHYQIRPEATWDDGTPITADDVEFSLKVIKNPHVDCPRLRPYFEVLDSFIKYPDDPRRFTLVAHRKYMLLESTSGDFSLLQKSFYDPEGLTDHVSIYELTRRAEAFAGDEKLKKFAEQYNAIKHQENKIRGSGPYLLVKWERNRYILLRRKASWWGDKIKDTTTLRFTANPPQIQYLIINDLTTARVALEGEKLDVVSALLPKDFIELKNNQTINQKYNFYQVEHLAYTYIGLNTKDPRLSDKRIRKALAHLVNRNLIIEKLLYGMATTTESPIHPSNKKYYNHTLTPYEYNPEKAKQLLKEAGWQDSDGDGILDKTVNGKKLQLAFQFLFNSGNDIRKNIGIILQEEARKIGIKIEVIGLEWGVFLERLNRHEFDMFALSWISTPLPSDPKQIWHTSAYRGGDNVVGFGNAYTDSLIEAIRTEMDEDKRASLWKELQAIIHDEVPYIFLYVPMNLIAIHKRLGNVVVSVMRPGYYVPSFTISSRARVTASR